MPLDPTRIISIIRELEQTSPEALQKMDRELLLSIRQTLREHQREVEICFCDGRSWTSSN
jgi:hypothetical protein